VFACYFKSILDGLLTAHEHPEVSVQFCCFQRSLAVCQRPENEHSVELQEACAERPTGKYSATDAFFSAQCLRKNAPILTDTSGEFGARFVSVRMREGSTPSAAFVGILQEFLVLEPVKKFLD